MDAACAIKFFIALIVVNSVVGIDVYKPRPLTGGACLSPETIAQAELDIQDQLEMREKCQGNVDSLREEIRQLRAGSSRDFPATSCLEIHQSQPNTRSGFYWIQSSEERDPVQAFCDMRRECCGTTSGGWLRAAYLNMTNSSQQCPSQWTEVNNMVRACVRNTPSAGCRSEVYDTNGVSYSQICGRVIGYQFCVANAFGSFSANQSLTINDVYVDGVSITRGSPREHVWTFAIAESDFPGAFRTSLCPCTTGQVQVQDVEIPPFVGTDYFCESGFSGDRPSCDFSTGLGIHYDDQVWDGQDCRQPSTCCEFNNPPWFCKQLPESTSDSIEVRLCIDHDRNDRFEEVLVELIEIYVR